MSLGFALLVVAVALLIPTAYAGLIGAPYAPTRLAVVRKAFDAIKLGEGDTLVDLGAGDGGILLEASRRGAKAIGYELSPIMWLIAWARTRFPLLERKGEVVVKFANFYTQDLSSATVIFAFLMPKNMPRVREFLKKQQIPNGRYFLTYAFSLPDAVPVQVVSVPDKGKIYIYDLQSLTISAISAPILSE